MDDQQARSFVFSLPERERPLELLIRDNDGKPVVDRQGAEAANELCYRLFALRRGLEPGA